MAGTELDMNLMFISTASRIQGTNMYKVYCWYGEVSIPLVCYFPTFELAEEHVATNSRSGHRFEIVFEDLESQ